MNSGSSTPGSPCLCTLDRSASFTPRWRPPFVSELEPSDPLPPQWAWHGRGQTEVRHGAGRTDTIHGWRENKAKGGRGDRRGFGRSDHPRPVDAAFAALVTPAGSGSASRGAGTLRVYRPEHRQVRASRRDAWLHARRRLRGGRSPSSAFHKCARVLSSAASPSPSGWPKTNGPAVVCVIDLRSGQVVGLLRFETAVQEMFAVTVARPALPRVDQRRREVAGEFLRGPDECLDEGRGDRAEVGRDRAIPTG